MIVNAIREFAFVLETHRYPDAGVLKSGAQHIDLRCPVSATHGSGAANNRKHFRSSHSITDLDTAMKEAGA